MNRIVVEHHFRDPQGGIEVLVSKTTLAAGINAPASTVMLAGKNSSVRMDVRSRSPNTRTWLAGRAASDSTRRPRRSFWPITRSSGVSCSIDVGGDPGDPRRPSGHASLTVMSVRIISLLWQVKAVKEFDVPRLLPNTHGGFLARDADPKWQAETEIRIAGMGGPIPSARPVEATG